MEKLKVFTAFSGYDSQCMALDRLGIDYDLVGWSEIDRYAIQAHNAVYPRFAERNFGDISKIDWSAVPTFDLFTYSFPCQDISNAGLQRGLSEGAGTRSSLLWECEKAIEAKRPKFLLMENVKALAGKKFLPDLHRWMRLLEGYGYTNFVQVLNAKDYGVPQNRERCFMVSILGSSWYDFPQPFKLGSTFHKYLECGIGDEYYQNNDNGVYTNVRINRVFRVPKFNKWKVQYLDTYSNLVRDDIFGTITTRVSLSCCSFIYIPERGVRKPTERECFRLMGVGEENIDRIQSAGISRTQQYKMAGNSIVVDVLVEIFKNLLK